MIQGQNRHFSQQRQRQRQPSGPFDELSSLVLNILRTPTSSIQLPGVPSTPLIRRRRSPQTINPAGIASLMLGVSLTLMLCGSVTFFIGFFLLPWVIGLVMVFYFVGLVSSLSVLGRAIICYATSPSLSPPPSPSSSRKDFPAWKFM